MSLPRFHSLLPGVDMQLVVDSLQMMPDRLIREVEVPGGDLRGMPEAQFGHHLLLARAEEPGDAAIRIVGDARGKVVQDFVPRPGSVIPRYLLKYGLNVLIGIEEEAHCAGAFHLLHGLTDRSVRLATMTRGQRRSGSIEKPAGAHQKTPALRGANGEFMREIISALGVARV